MTPLTVTWAPTLPTDVGLDNLLKFTQSGFDNIKGTPNGIIHKKLTQVTFEENGHHFLPFIFGQLNFPFNMAVNFNIPLVFFGEDGDIEYGGSLERINQPTLESNYNISSKLKSKPPEYWSKFGIDNEELRYYMPPKNDRIQETKMEAHYMSYYEEWKPEQHYEIAKKHTGFEHLENRTEGTFTNYASLDDKTDGFHYYMAFIKYGIGRTTSDASHQIRDNIITRDEAVELVLQYDGEYPKLYEKEFLEYLEIDDQKLKQIIDKFRRSLIWGKDDDEWVLNHIVKKL
jgi:N-acetyl sugar amidotransferase